MQDGPLDLAGAHGSPPQPAPAGAARPLPPGPGPASATIPAAPARARPRPPFSAAALLAWALVALTLGAQQWIAWGGPPRWVQDRIGHRAAGGEAAPEPPPNLEFELLARLHTGIKLWTTSFGPAAGAGGPTGVESLRELDRAAESPADRLRLVPVAGELQGSEQALARVNDLLDEGALGGPLRNDAHALLAIYRDGPDTLDSPARERLRRRHRWFADLALSHGLPEQDPRRQAATGPAFRTAAGLILAMLTGLAIGAASLALCVLGLVLFTRRKLHPVYRADADEPAAEPPPTYAGLPAPEPSAPDPDPAAVFALPSPQPAALNTIPAPARPRRSVYLEAFALYLFSFLAFMIAIELLTERSLAAIWLYLLFTPVVVLWPRLRGESWRAWREGMGLHRGRGVLREMAAGVAGYLAGLPVVAVGLILTLMLVGVAKLWDDAMGGRGPTAAQSTGGRPTATEALRDLPGEAARRATDPERWVETGPVPADGLSDAAPLQEGTHDHGRRSRMPTHPIAYEVAGGLTAGKALLLFLLASVWAPLMEETMFRGALYHHLRQRFNWLASGLLVGVVFAVVHPQGLLAVPALAAIALVMATLREWRGSLIAPMTAHALNNGLVVALLVTVAG